MIVKAITANAGRYPAKLNNKEEQTYFIKNTSKTNMPVFFKI